MIQPNHTCQSTVIPPLEPGIGGHEVMFGISATIWADPRNIVVEYTDVEMLSGKEM
jgi:hypothetical protein